MITPREATIKTSQIIKDMKAVDINVSSTIVVEDMEVDDNFMEIATINHDNPSSALHATKKAIAMQTVHRRIELIWSFVLAVVWAITQ